MLIYVPLTLGKSPGSKKLTLVLVEVITVNVLSNPLLILSTLIVDPVGYVVANDAVDIKYKVATLVPAGIDVIILLS